MKIKLLSYVTQKILSLFNNTKSKELRNSGILVLLKISELLF